MSIIDRKMLNKMGKCRIITSAYILVRLLKMISSLLIFLYFTLHKINKRKLCSAIAQNICSICWVTTIHFRSNWIHTSSLACICQYKSIIRIILIYYCSWSLLYYSNVLIFFPDLFSKCYCIWRT